MRKNRKVCFPNLRFVSINLATDSFGSSGKSTILLTLLHLLDTQVGSIKIDGIDISHVPRSILRQQCFITVPQDTFVFINASLRSNLDPSEALNDKTIIDALEKTCLWQHFAAHNRHQQDLHLPETDNAEEVISSILDLQLSAFPVLSTGQMQLLSLARAILRTQVQVRFSDEALITADTRQPKRILLLDEATSSLDPKTDSIMQDVIRKEFTAKGHTVIAISHRLGAPSPDNSERVIWIRDGRINKVAGS